MKSFVGADFVENRLDACPDEPCFPFGVRAFEIFEGFFRVAEKEIDD